MKPVKINISDIQEVLHCTYDLFICSSSFEDRCLSVADNISVEKFRKALIVSNIDLIEQIGENKDTLEKRFGNRSNSVNISTSDPLLTADSLGQNLTKIMNDGIVGSILLDVTTFTHESLLILLRLLKMYCPKSKITGIYSNASEYSVGDKDDYKWLSRGIGEVRSVLGFPGNIVPSRKTHLIVIVGYEHERAMGIIETIEPNSIALGYGRSDSTTTDKDKNANEHYMHLVEEMATSFSDVEHFEIPCNNPFKTRDEILHQIKKAGDVNVLIAPMNNKLSTIGAAWAAFRNENVQICYAQALRYNYSNYSSPGHHCYIFDFDEK